MHLDLFAAGHMNLEEQICLKHNNKWNINQDVVKKMSNIYFRNERMNGRGHYYENKIEHEND